MTHKGLIEKDIPAPSHLFLKLHTMLTNLKKLVALSGAVALVAMNLVPAGVGAATVNNGFAAAATDDITITSALITAATSVTVRVEKDGVTVPTVLATVTGNVITVIDPDGDAGNGLDAGYYVITFNTNNGHFGSATLDNSATYNKVNVTATVVPTLSLSLVTNNASLGVLSPGVFSATPVDVDLTYSTNAKSGLTVAMASTGLKDTAADHEIHATGISAMTTNDGVYAVETALGAGNASVTAGSPAVAATQNVVTSTGAPVDNVTTNVQVGAEITNTTVSGNYTDTLTFTVTGTF